LLEVVVEDGHGAGVVVKGEGEGAEGESEAVHRDDGDGGLRKAASVDRLPEPFADGAAPAEREIRERREVTHVIR
jgi:hypothetical protein